VNLALGKHSWAKEASEHVSDWKNKNHYDKSYDKDFVRCPLFKYFKGQINENIDENNSEYERMMQQCNISFHSDKEDKPMEPAEILPEREIRQFMGQDDVFDKTMNQDFEPLSRKPRKFNSPEQKVEKAN
jgi:hypothetical protein